MILYPSAQAFVEQDVASNSARWLTKAAARTGIFAQLGAYAEEYVDPAGKSKKLAPFWGDVKPFYMLHQHNKCIYCETRMEGREFATVQWDLEHFRPKGSVRSWPSTGAANQYGFPTGDKSASGYYLLAYHLHNYAAACKTCNSPFKSDYFPVANSRVSGMPSPSSYSIEEPYLVYALDAAEEDPEDLIHFVGVEAEPRYKADQDIRKWRRARVMIDFFGLNRDGLHETRALWLLRTVWPSVRWADSGDPEGIAALQELRKEYSQYASCTKCFLQLCESERPSAVGLLPVFNQILITATG